MRLEGFLKLDRLQKESDLLRARVVYGCALMFAALQVVNIGVLLHQYGGYHPQVAVAVAAMILVGSLPVLLRWTVSGGVFATIYTAFIFLGVLAANLVAPTPPIGSGADSALLPLLVVSCGLVAWLGSWRPVVAYVVAGLGLIWGLHAMGAAQLDGASELGLGLAARDALAFSFRQNAVQASLALVIAGAVAAPFGHTLYKLVDRLEAAAEEARRIERVKSAFHANMNHEIRSPLSGILGMSELLSRTRLDDDQKEYVDLISECGDGLLRVLGDVLDVSKLDEDRLELVHAPFDLRDLLTSVVGLHSPRAKSKGLWVGVIWSQHLPTRVIGDEARLRQIVGNLMSNAVKFTDDGGACVQVSGDIKDGILTVVFSVQDTGCGIPEEDHGRIFDRYAQSEAGRAQGSGGTGLGLSIARDLVRLMGGELQVANVPGGRGTAFTWTSRFPLAEDAWPDEPARTTPEIITPGEYTRESYRRMMAKKNAA